MSQEEIVNPIYSKSNLEFITVASEYCAFVESAESLSRTDFVSKCTKLLPLIYLKVSLLPELPQLLEEEVETFVTEADYSFVQGKVVANLGQFDDYLEVFHSDIDISDTPIGAAISEGLADIYQVLKDCLMNYQVGSEEVMNDGLRTCAEQFKEFWGQTLCNVLRALHAIAYRADLEESDEDTTSLAEEDDDEIGTGRDTSNWILTQRQQEYNDDIDEIF